MGQSAAHKKTISYSKHKIKFDSKPFTLLNVGKNVNVLMKVILCCVIVFHGWFIFVVLPYYLGCDPFNQNVWKFRFKTQWVSLVQLEKFWKNWSTFWGGPLFPVRLVGILVEWITPLESPLAPAGQDLKKRTSFAPMPTFPAERISQCSLRASISC